VFKSNCRGQAALNSINYGGAFIMALDFNEMDLVNIKANKFDKLEHIFETFDNETETEILPEIVSNNRNLF
jgi:sulfate adenylyltransferase subunit 1 (EFTu-like GTPase family)